MLDTKKIQEAEKNVRRYLEDGLLKKTFSDIMILQRYIDNSEESINVAHLIFKNRVSDLWVIVSCYYSMYYIANAVLLKLGYKVGDKVSHKVTADCLFVFVRDKIRKSLLQSYEEAQDDALELVQNKADGIILNYDYEREKRSRFQYNMDEELKSSKAQTSLTRAKEFITEMKNLLEKRNE